jgi:hypothetical protein
MLTLSPQSLAALREARVRSFAEELLPCLRRGFPRETGSLTDAELRRKIHTGIAKGRRFGIVRRDDLARFLCYTICYGDDFETRPELAWAAAILAARDLTGTAKMDRIDRQEAASRFAAWKAVLHADL